MAFLEHLGVPYQVQRGLEDGHVPLRLPEVQVKRAIIVLDGAVVFRPRRPEQLEPPKPL
jgi:hypothetical protein